jgi:hypothetical protein
MRLLVLALCAPLLALAPACSGGAEPVVLDGVALDGTYPARCGCAIDSIGHCGNYVVVDGAPVELEGDLGLGAMEFCGQDGRSARVAGIVHAGKVTPSEFELAD